VRAVRSAFGRTHLVAECLDKQLFDDGIFGCTVTESSTDEEQ